MVINVGRSYFFHLLTTKMGTVYIMLQCMVWSYYQLSLVTCASLVKFGELVNPAVWLCSFQYRIHQMVSRISVTTNLRIYQKTEFVYLFLCTNNVNNNIYFRWTNSQLQNSFNYLKNSIQICEFFIVNPPQNLAIFT